MNDANAVLNSQVLKTVDGQVIAFWRGELVLKLDRGVRYFKTEHQAWDFLARRESFANSSVGLNGARAGARKSPKLDR
jgi:hypothetical protein